MDKTIELVNGVKDIHAMPSVIVKALNIMKKPTASMKELGDIVMYDQSLTIKFLALVNSAYYGFSQQISSISIALSLLGMVKVKNIIVDQFTIDPETMFLPTISEAPMTGLRSGV